MSLLPRETSLFPNELFSSSKLGEGSWWVLHTRPRAEKAVARKLLTRGVAYFLPLYEKQRRYSGRLRSAFFPLFPGYVFLFGDNEARIHALESNQVARTIPVANQAELHQDLFHVHKLLTTDAAALPETYLQPGSPVEIVHGPLSGMQGKLISRGKNLKFYIEVRMLQQGVSVEIESWMVRSLIIPDRSGRPDKTGAGESSRAMRV